MMSKFKVSLLFYVGLTFPSTWEETESRLRESSGKVVWKTVRIKLEATESLSGFGRKLSDRPGLS